MIRHTVFVDITLLQHDEADNENMCGSLRITGHARITEDVADLVKNLAAHLGVGAVTRPREQS